MVEQIGIAEKNPAASQGPVADENRVAEQFVDQPDSAHASSVQPVGSWFGLIVKEVLQVVVPAILLALSVHIFLAQATVVYGQSMQPILQPAERLVIEKVSYYFGPPQRNDIVVVDLPQMSDLLIKRVVGLPSEVVELREGQLLINGQPIDQSFIRSPGGATYGPVILGPDAYFVMGDNRNNSNDSRVLGEIPRDAIVGRAWMRYWPLNRFQIFD